MCSTIVIYTLGINTCTTKMKSLTGISQCFGKCTKGTYKSCIFAEHVPMTAFALKHDHDIIILKYAKALKLFYMKK